MSHRIGGWLGLVALIASGCFVQQPAQQPGQPAAQPAQPAQATAGASANGQLYDPEQHVVVVNGEPLSTEIKMEFARYGLPLPAGNYWYDRRSGAFGIVGGPTAIFLAANLPLPGQVSADASGALTQVYINGRALHPTEVQYLMQLTGQPIQPGRYFLDPNGDVGYEGGPPVANLVQIANARAGAGGGGGQQGGGYFHRGWGGTVSSDGQCYYVSTSSGSVMGPGC